jgi:hypothetical protein
MWEREQIETFISLSPDMIDGNFVSDIKKKTILPLKMDF